MCKGVLGSMISAELLRAFISILIFVAHKHKICAWPTPSPCNWVSCNSWLGGCGLHEQTYGMSFIGPASQLVLLSKQGACHWKRCVD